MNKKSLLIVTYIIPFPPDAGGKVSIFGTINYLRKFYDITLVFAVYSETESDNIIELKRIWPEVKIAVFEGWQPSSRQTKPSLKSQVKGAAKSILSLFRSKQNIVLQYKVQLQDWEKFPFMPLQKEYISFIGEVLEQNEFDLIQVEYTGLMNLIHILPKNAKSIYVQIESRNFILRDFYAKEKDDSLYAKYVVENARFLEMKLLEQYDYVFALSKADKESLSAYKDDREIFYAPFPVLDSYFAEQEVLLNYQPEKLVYVGSQAHSPNIDAITWFIENVYHEVYQKTKLRLFITGKWEPKYQEKYPEVTFTGFIPDLNVLLKNSILIVPIFLGGGGLRAKVLQAMAAYTPVISTKLGCEGIDEAERGKHILVAENANEFIEAIELLVNNPDDAKSIIKNARTLIEKSYSEKAVGEIRSQAYQNILTHQ